ncbi:MAG: hypothetical protein ACE5DR_04470, partial [Thermodesulfobacteriota bacterium]
MSSSLVALKLQYHLGTGEEFIFACSPQSLRAGLKAGICCGIKKQRENAKMKKKMEKAGKKIILFAAGLFAVLIMPATSPAIEVSGTAGLDVMTNYVWRGQQLSDDHGVLQPYLEASYNGVTVNFWANEDLQNTQHTETDFTLSYSREIQKLAVDAGYIYYALDGFDDTQEFYLTLAVDVIGSPSITYYGDFDEGRGGFLVVSIGHSLALPKGMTLSGGFSASVNFRNAIMGTDRTGSRFTNFYNGEVSASLAIPVT